MSEIKESFRDAIGCVMIPAVVMAAFGVSSVGCHVVRYINRHLDAAPPAACTCPAPSEGGPR